MSRFFVTTAIDYVNSRPHLGTAYEKITADVIARYKRLAGVPTRFLMGNDEHSQNVYRRARELGLDPIAYCDQMAGEFREVWSRLNVSFDDFIRTTEPRHRVAVETIVRQIADAGDLYEAYYEGAYCVSCEAFKPAKDLVDGRCPVHGIVPDEIREKNHFFRLSRYRDALLAHLDRHPEMIEPEVRRNEILRLLEGGLDDISISRAGQHWGIPLPIDPASVVYVWFDALVNYISAIGYGADEEQFRTWWPASLHIVGKDITRFHCVVWPAMLMSAGLPVPRQVFGHGFVSFKGQKMSKSLGTVLEPLEVADRFGPDPLRLYLVKEIPYGQDGDFSWERFEERYNVDLANNLGNLVNRLAVMAHKYRGGRLAPSARPPGRLAEVASHSIDRYRRAMDGWVLHEGVASAFALVDAANEYIAETAPWTLVRQVDGGDRLDRVLEDVAEAIRIAAVLLQPVMPASAAELLRRVGSPVTAEALVLGRDGAWAGGFDRTIAGAEPMWPRIEEAATAGGAMAAAATPRPKELVIMSEQEPARTALQPPAGQPVTTAGRITIDEFMRVELRVAKVIDAERVKGSKKLIRMDIDLGAEQRTIVAGIAEAYSAESLVGRTIVVVANLQPAKLMGIESNGMVLAASPEGGLPVLVGLDSPLPPGTRVR